jgi:hypothetical protein
MFDAFPLKELARGNSDLHRPSVFPKPWHLRHWPTTRRRVHSRALRSYLTNTTITSGTRAYTWAPWALAHPRGEDHILTATTSTSGTRVYT